MEAPDFWNDPEVSQNKMKEVKSLKDDVATYAALSTQYDDIETMIEMGYEENDPELIPEIDQMMKEFVQTYEDIRMKRFCRENMTGTMPLFPCMRGRVARNPVTGQPCSIVCISDGQIKRDFPWKCWILWMEKRPESNPLHFR